MPDAARITPSRGWLEYVKVGPMQFQRFGLRCFVWAWQRGNHRPVATLRFGWHLALGCWLGRDEDDDIEFSASLLVVHLVVVVTTWGVPESLRAWADMEDDDAA